MPDRIIRDELLTSERYWSVSPEARNLYLSILLSADDLGRFTGSNFALRTKCMAGTVTPGQLEKLLAELIDVDLIRSYPQGPSRFLLVPRFRQRLRYPHSKYPDPPESATKESQQIKQNPIKKTDHSPTTDGPKPDPSPTQDGPKTAEVKRSEVKRSEERGYVVPSGNGSATPPALQTVLDNLHGKNQKHKNRRQLTQAEQLEFTRTGQMPPDLQP